VPAFRRCDKLIVVENSSASKQIPLLRAKLDALPPPGTRLTGVLPSLPAGAGAIDLYL
jgi:hypothetical protein